MTWPCPLEGLGPSLSHQCARTSFRTPRAQSPPTSRLTHQLQDPQSAEAGSPRTRSHPPGFTLQLVLSVTPGPCPFGRPTSALRHLGSFIQQPQDMALPTSGSTPALGPSGPCNKRPPNLALPICRLTSTPSHRSHTSRPTAALGLHGPHSQSCREPAPPTGRLVISHLMSWPHQGRTWQQSTGSQPHLPDHPQWSAHHNRRTHAAHVGTPLEHKAFVVRADYAAGTHGFLLQKAASPRSENITYQIHRNKNSKSGKTRQ